MQALYLYYNIYMARPTSNPSYQEVKVKLLLRHDFFNDELRRIRRKFGMNGDGYKSMKSFVDWMNTEDISPDKWVTKSNRPLDELISEEVNELRHHFKLSHNYIEALMHCVYFGRNIDFSKVDFYDIKLYTSIDDVFDEDFTEGRMLLEIYPEASNAEVYEFIKEHRKDLDKKIFNKHKQNRARKYFDFNLDVYDAYVEAEEGKKSKDVAVHISDKYDLEKRLNFRDIDDIVTEIRSEIAGL